MKSFLKDNQPMIVKLVVYQVALTIFGFVLAMACVKSQTLLVLSSVLSIAFYLFLIYFVMYEQGQKDGIRISAGRLDYNPMRGALIALCANLLNIVLAILAIIGKACITNVSFSSMEGIGEASPGWAASLFGVSSSIAEWIQCMYQGVCQVVFGGHVLTLLLRPLPAILFCGIAYPLGVKYSSGFLAKKKDSDRYR